MSFKSVIRKSVAGAALGLGLFAVAAPAANAAPSGSVVDGCQAQIYNTAFSTSCTNVTSGGWFHTTGWCDYQPTVTGPKVYLATGSSANGVSAGECTFGVVRAQTYKS